MTLPPPAPAESLRTHPRRRWQRTVTRSVAVALLAPTVVMVGIYAHWDLRERRLVTIVHGTVYQSSVMPSPKLLATVDTLHLRTVIDLRDTEPELVAAERDVLRTVQVEHRHVPMPQEPSADDLCRFFAAVDAATPPILVHCKHGEGRSVLLCALYRIERSGWSNDAAWQGTARLPDSLRFLRHLWPGLRCLSPSSTKGRMVLEHVPTEERQSDSGSGK
jgi:protein-tyrosine phosphatase